MKSFLQNIALLTFIALIAGCGGGGGGTVDVVPEFPDPPESGITGQVVKGVVSGATITVTDASGGSVATTGSTSTDANGDFDIRFSVPAIEGGISTPVTITSTGGSTTCDWNVEGEEDCPVFDGTFVAFGETYPFSSDATLSAISSNIAEGDDVTISVNINPVTHLAAAFANGAAAGSPLTADLVTTAAGQALGLVQALTDVDLFAANFATSVRDTSIIDITAISGEIDGVLADNALALSVFAPSIVGLVVNNAELNSVSEALVYLTDNLTLDGPNLQATGTFMGELARATEASALILQSELLANALVVPVALSNMIIDAGNARRLYELVGSRVITIPPPIDPNSAEAIAATKRFVRSLSAVINSILTTTGAENFGGTQLGATEVFADELNAVALLSSGTATRAFEAVSNALVEAEDELEPGGSDSSEEGDDITGTISLSADGNTVTITDVGTSLTEGDVTVMLDIASGTRTATETDASLTLTGVTMATWQGEALLQTFTGDLTLTFVEEADDLGLNEMTLNGWITVEGDPGTTFAVDASLTGLTGSTVANAGSHDIDGEYTTTFTFTGDSTEDLTVAMNGALHGLNQNFAISAGTRTIWGTVDRDGDIDTDTLTDMTVTLTLVLDLSANGVLVSGSFSVGGVETATMDDAGIVYYTDGSVQALPATIF